MENLIIIQISKDELRSIIREEIQKLKLQAENSQHDNDYLSVTEASEYLGIAKQTIYKYTSERFIPFKKVGKKLYFKKSELNEWLDAATKEHYLRRLRR
jgi:excisionase family DNA binding protein